MITSKKYSPLLELILHNQREISLELSGIHIIIIALYIIFYINYVFQIMYKNTLSYDFLQENYAN